MRVRRRQDLLVVRELAVDEAADEVDALEVEDDLVLGRCQDDVDGIVAVRQHALELVVRAGRDHDRRLLDRIQGGQRLDRDAVVVGGRERQPVALEASQHAGQDRSRLVGRGGEDDLREGLLQRPLADARRGPLPGRGDDRELVGVDAAQVRPLAATAEVERGGAVGLEVDPLAGWQRVDDVRDQPGRDRQAAIGLDLAGHPVADADLEVRGGQPEARILGPEQDVGQHRQRAPRADGSADDLEAASQVLLHHG